MWSLRVNRLVSSPTDDVNAGEMMRPHQSRLHLFEILAIPAALLSLGDAFLTQYLVGINRAKEGNPLMARLLLDHQFLGFKLIGTGACLVILWQVSKRFPRLAGMVTLFIMLFYCAVLVRNSSVLANV